VTKVRASSGHHLTHCGPSGSSLQALQVKATFRSGWSIIAPKLQAATHQLHPLQADSSTLIMPVFSSCERASLGQAAMHGGSSQCLQVTAMFSSGPMRIARILDLVGL